MKVGVEAGEGDRCLHVEYADRGKEYGIRFIFSLLCEYTPLEYVRIHVIYRVNQAEYGIQMLLVAPQEYVNLYSTRRARCGVTVLAHPPEQPVRVGVNLKPKGRVRKRGSE